METEPEFVNTTKKMSRYPYKKPTGHETIYVENSDFPYYKPKAVTVRPRPLEKLTPHQVSRVRNDDINDVHGTQFLIYNERYPEKMDIFSSQKQNSTCHYVNEKRWSMPNVMPTSLVQHRTVTTLRGPGQQNVIPSKHDQSESILVHRTVAQLRASNQVQPYGRHYSYVCDMKPGGISVDLTGCNRPPTPSPDTWYPARRTSDYLVASSLLAMEQQRDRRKDLR